MIIMRYKKGDLVRVIRDGKFNKHQNTVGRVYKVLKVLDTYPPYRLQRYGPYHCEDDDLQLVNFSEYLNKIK